MKSFDHANSDAVAIVVSLPSENGIAKQGILLDGKDHILSRATAQNSQLVSQSGEESVQRMRSWLGCCCYCCELKRSERKFLTGTEI